ncbi:MAG: sigma 54-dependent Fis family transcriptional regulator [Labilithrix sp.]|nr:sigma 54-dependent Fis family transcriptional regulator [Labilithrix sp.]MCW5812198.1 sigma 54-dependent Fis family transcriptional regulator [Labilithrix sp.]
MSIGDVTRSATSGGKPILIVRAAALTVVKGNDVGKGARTTSPSFVIGSGPNADLQVSDHAVSREHVILSLEPSGIRLRDRSKNGTKIGGVRVVEAVITADTVLTLGGTSIALQLEAEKLVLPLSEQSTFGDAFGSAPVMRHLFSVLEEAARSDISVLLEGESGVGKDVLARAIHQTSLRRDGPFVVVDCGTMPPNLIESELFGHVRGAFTGATEDRRGLFEEADGGTLFLDEIGELPLDMQPKLLRALETKEVRPVGGKKTKKADVRVVSATNKKLAEGAKRGSFREDLYYRLAVARVTVPSLRDRPDDVLPLATRFLRTTTGDDAAQIPADLAAMLAEYSWPGNVRELRNVIERHVALGDTAIALLVDEKKVRAASERDDLSAHPYHEARRLVLERFEREYIPGVLARTNGVVARAAEHAQIARPSFYRLLERLRIADEQAELKAGGDKDT